MTGSGHTGNYFPLLALTVPVSVHPGYVCDCNLDLPVTGYDG